MSDLDENRPRLGGAEAKGPLHGHCHSPGVPGVGRGCRTLPVPRVQPGGGCWLDQKWGTVRKRGGVVDDPGFRV